MGAEEQDYRCQDRAVASQAHGRVPAACALGVFPRKDAFFTSLTCKIKDIPDATEVTESPEAAEGVAVMTETYEDEQALESEFLEYLKYVDGKAIADVHF